MYPHTKFGFNLWRLREAKGRSSREMAEALGLPLKSYQDFEMGKRLPDAAQFEKIAHMLGEDLESLKSWAVFPARPISHGKVLPCTEDYQKRLQDEIVSLKNKYQKNTGLHLNGLQIHALETLTLKITKITDLPVLPMNFILICDALFSVEAQKYKHLCEYRDFITKGESLAGFLSRDLYFGPFIFFAANMLYFAEKPFQNLEDCFDSLTFAQFKNLFLLACVQNGIYEIETDIPRLQQHADFSSLSCLFVRELERELKNNVPSEINFSILYQACLLQGVGQYVLFAKLRSSILNYDTSHLENDDDSSTSALDSQLFREILWSLHPVVSAIIGANWLFPKAVLDILLTHHDHPVSRVNPNTALLKIINFFVDKDFPKIEKADLDDLMKAYPQVKIPAEALYKVSQKLAEIKTDLYERSSTLIEENNQALAEHFALGSKKPAETGKPHIAPEKNLQAPLKRSDFRFDPKFQAILKNVAHERYERLLADMLLAQKNEPLKKLTERQAAFNLGLSYLLSKNIEDVAKDFGISVDEVLLRLQNHKP